MLSGKVAACIFYALCVWKNYTDCREMFQVSNYSYSRASVKVSQLNFNQWEATVELEGHGGDGRQSHA